MELSQALITGQNLSLSEALNRGLMVTGVGLSIVFAVLVILMIVLYLFKVVFYKDPSKAVKKTDVTSVETVAVAGTEIEETDEEELIAVLTAAIAASLNTSTYNLKIKSYRRIDNNISAWNKAGVTETINNRF